MRTRMMIVFGICFVAGSAVGDDTELPEAAQMFERLIKRIPAGIDAHEVHKYVGKEFNFVFNGGSRHNHGVQWAPFWVSKRLYCVYRPQTDDGLVEVYRIIEPDLKSRPFTPQGLAAYNQFPKLMKKHPGAFRMLDLHAVIDYGAELSLAQMRFKRVYSSKPGATRGR